MNADHAQFVFEIVFNDAHLVNTDNKTKIKKQEYESINNWR